MMLGGGVKDGEEMACRVEEEARVRACLKSGMLVTSMEMADKGMCAVEMLHTCGRTRGGLRETGRGGHAQTRWGVQVTQRAVHRDNAVGPEDDAGGPIDDAAGDVDDAAGRAFAGRGSTGVSTLNEFIRSGLCRIFLIMFFKLTTTGWRVNGCFMDVSKHSGWTHRSVIDEHIEALEMDASVLQTCQNGVDARRMPVSGQLCHKVVGYRRDEFIICEDRHCMRTSLAVETDFGMDRGERNGFGANGCAGHWGVSMVVVDMALVVGTYRCSGAVTVMVVVVAVGTYGWSGAVAVVVAAVALTDVVMYWCGGSSGGGRDGRSSGGSGNGSGGGNTGRGSGNSSGSGNTGRGSGNSSGSGNTGRGSGNSSTVTVAVVVILAMVAVTIEILGDGVWTPWVRRSKTLLSMSEGGIGQSPGLSGICGSVVNGIFFNGEMVLMGGCHARRTAKPESGVSTLVVKANVAGAGIGKGFWWREECEMVVQYGCFIGIISETAMWYSRVIGVWDGGWHDCVIGVVGGTAMWYGCFIGGVGGTAIWDSWVIGDVGGMAMWYGFCYR
ncbi:hypothetical protein BU17DRAFT_66327 [Hysterangium stoloniferum]|nr:hypothetical protein BU17DRAFT_66327 [Hysterangium stoloniferum]